MSEKLKEECLIVCYGWFSDPLLTLDGKHQKILSNGNVVAIAKSYSLGYGNYICLKTQNGNIINLKQIDNVEDVDYEVKSFNVYGDEVSVRYKDDYGFHTVTYSLSEIPSETIQESIIERAVYDFGESIRWGKNNAKVWAGGVSSMPFGYKIDMGKKTISVYFNVRGRSRYSMSDGDKYVQTISFENNQLQLVSSGEYELLNGCFNSSEEIDNIINTINKNMYWKDIIKPEAQ